MGMIARVKQFLRRTTSVGSKVDEAVVDPGGGANLTAEVFQPSGDDAQPLPTDYAILLEFLRTGSVAVVGYSDHLNENVAGPGEKRIYSRDSNGAVVCSYYLKSDGSAVLENANGSITLNTDGSIELSSPSGDIVLNADGSSETSNSNGSIQLLANGTIDLNGVTIDTAGNVDANEVTVPGGIALGTHIHSSALGDTLGPKAP